jgi:Zn-dependent oligopeptidase
MGHKDRERLLVMKKEEHEKQGLPFDGEFYLWDYRYYDRKYIEKTLDLDDSLVKEYFPVSVVVPKILEIYQNLLSIKFVELKGDVWHAGSSTYRLSIGQISHNLGGMKTYSSSLFGRRTQKTSLGFLAIVILTFSLAVSDGLTRKD